MNATLTVLMAHNYSSWGGNLSTVLTLCKGLRNLGMNVLTAFPAAQPYAARFLEAGFPVFDVEVRSKWDLGAIARYRRVLKENGFNIVHTHTRRTDMAAGIAGQDGRTATVVTHHGQINLDPATFQFKNDLPARVYSFILRRFFSMNVAVSEEIARELAYNCRVHPDRIRRIPNGIDPAPFLRAADYRRATRSELRLAPDNLVVTLVGSIDRKGHKELTAAAAKLRPSFPKARYLYVGEGPRAAETAEHVTKLGLEGVVRLTGFREDVPAVLSASDVFCLPSYSEGLSVSIMEAMAAGLPVAASRAGGNEELVVEGETGLIFEPRDAGDLAEKLAVVLGDGEMRRKMGEAGRKRVLAEFTAENMVRRYAELYEAMVTV